MYISPNTLRPPVNLCEMSNKKSEKLNTIEKNKLRIARTIMKHTVIAIGGNGFEMINQFRTLQHEISEKWWKQLMNEHSINEMYATTVRMNLIYCLQWTYYNSLIDMNFNVTICVI